MTARFKTLPQTLLVLALWLCAVVPSARGFEIRAGADTVVELFTSQGCSRCPEADRLLAELGTREDIVALAYHIDYWDYVGWQDTFALAANTQLQKDYAKSWGKTRIYTPQMVINGAQGVVGSDQDEVEAAIGAAHTPLALTVSPAGPEAVTLWAPPDTALSPAIVWLVTYRDRAEVTIERGENSGRALTYTHIVTGRQAIGMWEPQTGARITVPMAEVLGSHSDGVAVIVQEKNGALPGTVLGTALVHR